MKEVYIVWKHKSQNLDDEPTVVGVYSTIEKASFVVNLYQDDFGPAFLLQFPFF